MKYSPNLSAAILVDNQTNKGYSHSFSENCRGEIVQAVGGEPFEENLLMRDNEDGSYQLVNLTPSGVTPEPARFVAASADLNFVVFSERAKLTPDAVSGAVNLYESREGALRLLKLKLPSGAPVAGSVVSISADGADVFFTANGNLYVRANGERTVQLDEPRGGSGPGGGGEFAGVTADGSRVFFKDDAAAGLTSDTVPGSGANLYSYDVNTGQLSDLTPVGDANAALAGISEDGSYVYFISKGVQSGTQANQFGETAQNGKPNLYLKHDGTITYLMDDALKYQEEGETVRVSPNGAFFVFNSANSLTGYENQGDLEIYLYSAATNSFACASCNPSGEAPTSGVRLGGPWVRQASNNGQVFFETTNALLPRDTNGKSDVYEFDSSSGLHLISTGTSAGESSYRREHERRRRVLPHVSGLVPQDSLQEANKIYDARVDGGFPEGRAAGVYNRRCVSRGGRTTTIDLRGAVEPDILRRRATSRRLQAEVVKKVTKKTVKCKKGFMKKKNKCVKAGRRSKEPAATGGISK